MCCCKLENLITLCDQTKVSRQHQLNKEHFNITFENSFYNPHTMLPCVHTVCRTK